MPTLIKAGYLEQLCAQCSGYKGWINHSEHIKKLICTVFWRAGACAEHGPKGDAGPTELQVIAGVVMSG